MHNVDVLSSARLEFREARTWYRSQSATAAKRFAMEVKKAIAEIREHPDQQLRWDDRYHFYLLNRFPYFIAYRYTADQLVVVAIRHAAQDQDAWIGR